jgi:membrane fusion protein, multidrug efflux system
VVEPRSLAVLSLLLVACRAAHAEPGATQANEAVPVTVSRVEKGAVDRPLTVGGTWKAKETSDLSFKVGGVVTGVLVEQGAYVRKGQPLARLDGASIEAGLSQARAGLEKAERDEKRLRTLFEKGSVPSQALDDGVTAVKSSRAAVQGIASDAGRTVLFAPDDGWIQRRSVEVGEVVAPGRPVFHFEGKTRGKVAVVSLVDRDALGFSLGAECTISFDAKPGSSSPCRVSEAARVARPGSGLLDLEVRPVTEGSKVASASAVDLPEGLTVKVSFRRRTEAVTVPLASLVNENGDRAAVLVPTEDATFRRVPVRIDRLFGDRVDVADLPADVERVVLRGARSLRDGDRIAIVP